MTNIEKQKKFIAEIEKEKSTRRNTIINDENIFRQLQSTHNELKAEYNGRQIFEMLQNIDDQSSDKCLIELNSTEKTLIFYNTGIPFSTEGVKSIMLHSISPKKNKEAFIGNKGLGFRSILNWSQEIEIYSDGKIISFSKEIAEKYSKIENTPELMFPNIDIVTPNNNWITYVKLKNLTNDIIDKIKKDLGEFDAKLLLFLKNLNSIVIKIDETEIHYNASPVKKLNEKILERTISYESKNNQFVEDNWWILSSNSSVKDKICNVQLAITPLNMENKNSALFNYLPTNHIIKLPCILHATLELTSSRKQIQDNSELNEEILTQIIPNAFKELAEFIRDNNKEDCWCAYRLMSAPEDSDDSLIKLLYSKILEIRDSGNFYPCIDETFKTKQDIVYYSEEINSYFYNECWKEKLPDIVRPNSPNEFKTDFYERTYLEEVCRSVVKKYEYSDSDLAKLIHVLYKMDKIYEPNKENLKPYRLIRDNDNKFIEGTALTPQDNENLKFPKYLKYTYISKEFYNLFCNEFEEEINAYKDESVKKRSFINSLKKDKFLNITFYDRSNLKDEIINKCRALIDKKSSIKSKNRIISKMLSALYENVKDTDNFDEIKIPVYVDSENQIIYTTDLLFKEAKIVYNNLLPDKVYLNDFSYWPFTKNESDEDLATFFKRLGVQEKIRLTSKHIDYKDDFFSYAIEKGFIDYGRLYEGSDCLVKALVDADIIKNLPMDVFLSLLPENVGGEKTFKDLLLETYHLSNWVPQRKINPCMCECSCSYPLYQLSGMMDKYLLNINNQTFKELGFIALDRNNTDEELMQKLGARQLRDFDLMELYELLRDIYIKNIKPSKVFYKYIFDAIKEHEDIMYNSLYYTDLMLYAQVGENDFEYRLNSEIYYDDNKSYGKIYLNKNFPVLFLQPKLGIDKVHQVFGIKKFGDAKIIKYDINEAVNKQFALDLKKYLPYFLAIRLYDKNIKDKNKFASALKNLKITIVNSLNYEIENSKFELDNGCFIYGNKEYFIKENGSIEDFHDDINFCANIANILTIELEALSEEQGYKNCYHNYQLYKDIFEQNPDFKKEVYELLSYSDSEKALWLNIINQTSKQGDYLKIQNEEQRIEQIKEDLNLSFNIDENNIDKNKKLEQLAKQFNCNVKDLIKGADGIIDFYDIHKKAFNDMLDKLKSSFCHLLWLYLNENKHLQQNYRMLINSYSSLKTSEKIAKICSENSKKEATEINYRKEIVKLLNENEWHNLTDCIQIDWNNLILNDLWTDKNFYQEYENNDFIQEDDKKFSLLFFKGNEDELKKIKEEHDENSKVSNEKDEENYKKLTLANWKLSEDVRFEKTATDRKKGTGKADSKKRANTNERSGRKAEEQVFAYLKEHNKENVKQVSGNSKSSDRDDSCHYDIQYQENGRIKYVEVKSAETSEFYITKAELEFAKQNKEDYILAIVKNGEVSFVANFVDEIGIYYKMKPDLYKVKFSIKDSTNS